MSLEAQNNFVKFQAAGLRGIVSRGYAGGQRYLSAEMQRQVVGLAKGEGFKRYLKKGTGSVALHGMKAGGEDVEVVVKLSFARDWAHWLVSVFRSPRSFKNFRKAMRLNAVGIAAEEPIAACTRRRAGFESESIYITRYVGQSTNLHAFVVEKLKNCRPAERRELARRVGELMARLHLNGLWHRDAKAGNFLVYREGGELKVMLIDLDGVKHYYEALWRYSARRRGFVNLAASVIGCREVTRSDMLRTVRSYCKLTGLGKDQCKEMMRQIEPEVYDKIVRAGGV